MNFAPSTAPARASAAPGRAPPQREQLLHLLAEAAEFEHNLLCCYLYAAFSLKRGERAADLLPHEAQAVARWHEAIMQVALEEMTHLALVANLAVALGSRPHFNRPNLPVAPGYHPAGIVIELAPFSLDTLDHFIFLERPQDAPHDDAPSFAAAVDPVAAPRGERPGSALMPAATDYDSIASFYERIEDELEALADAVGAPALFCADPNRQIGPELMSLPGLARITDLRSARWALETIIVQGEGSPHAGDDSHFAKFCTIREEFVALRAARAGFAPAMPVARNPVQRAPVAEGRVQVRAARAAAVMDAGNAVYNHLLRLLTQAWGRAQPDEREQRLILDAAVTMMQALAPIAEHLTTLPADDSQPQLHAGLSFAMLRAVEPLVEDGHELGLLGLRCDELAAGVEALQEPALARSAQVLREVGERLREVDAH